MTIKKINLISICFCLLLSLQALAEPLVLVAHASVPTTATEPFILLSNDRGVLAAVASTNELTQRRHGFTMVAVTTDSTGTNVIINMSEYNQLLTSERTVVMRELLEGISASQMNSRDRGRLFSFVENLDVSVSRFAREFSSNTTADVARGMAFIRPGMYPVSILLGIVVIAGFILIALQFGVDLLYCISPMTHFAFNRAEENKHGRKVRFITPEAQQSFDEYQSGVSDVTPVWGLVRARIASVFIFAVFSAILITGNFFMLLGVVMDFIDNAIRIFF